MGYFVEYDASVSALLDKRSPRGKPVIFLVTSHPLRFRTCVRLGVSPGGIFPRGGNPELARGARGKEAGNFLILRFVFF